MTLETGSWYHLRPFESCKWHRRDVCSRTHSNWFLSWGLLLPSGPTALVFPYRGDWWWHSLHHLIAWSRTCSGRIRYLEWLLPSTPLRLPCWLSWGRFKGHSLPEDLWCFRRKESIGLRRVRNWIRLQSRLDRDHGFLPFAWSNELHRYRSCSGTFRDQPGLTVSLWWHRSVRIDCRRMPQRISLLPSTIWKVAAANTRTEGCCVWRARSSRSITRLPASTHKGWSQSPCTIHQLLLSVWFPEQSS